MNTNQDFNSLKRKVYLDYHQDGILDIAASTVLLGFGAFMMTKSVVFLSAGAFVALFYALLKQQITIPRFGYVRFEPKEKTLTQNAVLVGIGVLVLFAFFAGRPYLGRTPEMEALAQQYHMVPLSALLFALPALVVAVLMNQKRFYLYALLLVALPALGALVNLETFVPILVSGVVILTFGALLLGKFVRKYPAAEKDGENDNG